MVLPRWSVRTHSTVVVLDFVIWLQHVLVHAVPALWRLHRIHHADLDYDLTTGARFHPLEIVLSMLVKLATITVLGPPVVAVILFEVILSGMAMFNHGNVGLPAEVDRRLRWMFVTPDMHRVHHSVEADETNSNFGFNLSWCDRLLGTYGDQPRCGHEGMAIGIDDHRDPREVDSLPGALAYTWLGYVGREAAAGGEGLIQKGLIALALLVGLAFLPRLIARLRQRPMMPVRVARPWLARRA